MSISFRESYVARPSSSPTSSGLGGVFTIAHRRINKLGQRSEISPTRQSVSFPTTLTPQTYSDTDGLLSDEFLASDDGGSTWRIIPRPTDEVGALTVASYSAAWATTTVAPNQSQTSFNLDFGEFSASANPTKILYLLNIGSSIRSLTFNFLDLITNNVANELAGRIEVEVLGLFPAAGNNPDNSFNTSFLWNLPQLSLNTVSLVAGPLSFLKVRIGLKNFPMGDMPSQLINLSLSTTINQHSFPLTYPNDWPNGSFLVDDDSPFRLPLVEAINTTTYRVKPFMVNAGGILRSNLQDRTLDVVAGDRRLSFDPSGNFLDQLATDTLPAANIALATFTMSAGGDITNLAYPWAIKPQSYARIGDTSALAKNRFCAVGGSNDIVYPATEGDAVGVTMGSNSNLVAMLGLVFIELASSISFGGGITANSSGQGVASASGIAIALESGASGQSIKAILRPAAGSSGGGGGGGGGLAFASISTDTTAAPNTQYTVDTSTAPVVVTLPDAPPNGTRLAFSDRSGGSPLTPTGFGLNSLTLNRSGSDTIHGQNSLVLNAENSAVTLVYVSGRWVFENGLVGVGGGSTNPDTIAEKPETDTAYTFVLSDADPLKIVTLDNAAAITATLPNNSTVAYPIGAQLVVGQKGAGATTISPAAGVNINGANTAVTLSGIWSMATLWKYGTNDWWITGGLL